MPELPTPQLDAYTHAATRGNALAAWCPFCEVWHTHGGPDGGHRLAHCAHPASPYASTGYELVIRGRFTTAVEAQYKRDAKTNRACAECGRGERLGTGWTRDKACHRWVHTACKKAHAGTCRHA